VFVRKTLTLRSLVGVLSLSAIMLSATSCRQGVSKADAADKIYTNAVVVTMNDQQPDAAAVAVKDGKIVAVGSAADLTQKYRGDATEVADLGGKTLMPGFIDPHSHFMDSLAMSDRINVSAPPIGPAKDPAQIVALLADYAKSKESGELIMGYGYDENLMPKGTHLTRDMLDKAIPNNPVVVEHVSKHGAVLNSLAFEKFGYKDGMPTPAGGVIARKPGTQKLDGLVMETAYMQVISSLPNPTPDQVLANGKAGQMIYAKAGVTTAQEGATHESQLEVLQGLAAKKALFIDVVTYPFITDLDKILVKNPPSSFGTYNNHLKLGGCKITLDGSPQGKTALFTTPYLTGGPTGQKNWVGEPTFPQDYANAGVKKCYDNKLQMLMHANGDGAVDMALKAHLYASAGSPEVDRRTVIIHSQFARKDQLEKYVQYKLIPSFFTEHTFLFSDAHIKNRGKEQAYFISPMRTAIDLGLRPTNHTDYAVAPIDQMATVWSAVNRLSRTGEVIGPDQRIKPIEALKAITINAAYQYGEESSKGSIEPGKRADLVVLDKNPLTVDPMAIKEIKVLETIKDGQTVYKAE
jgi:predicted amidohydrolase YtcJ